MTDCNDRTGARADRIDDVTYWPDHFGPMTWFRCVEEGCDVRVDPWDHSTRCPAHRIEAAARLERARAAVERGRRQTAHRVS